MYNSFVCMYACVIKVYICMCVYVYILNFISYHVCKLNSKKKPKNNFLLLQYKLTLKIKT